MCFQLQYLRGQNWASSEKCARCVESKRFFCNVYPLPAQELLVIWETPGTSSPATGRISVLFTLDTKSSLTSFSSRNRISWIPSSERPFAVFACVVKKTFIAGVWKIKLRNDRGVGRWYVYYFKVKKVILPELKSKIILKHIPLFAKVYASVPTCHFMVPRELDLADETNAFNFHFH